MRLRVRVRVGIRSRVMSKDKSKNDILGWTYIDLKCG